MGFLDRMFSIQQEEIFNAWKVLDKMEQLDQIIEDSYKKPVVLFKHSIRCGTSAMIKHQLEGNWNLKAEDLDFYYLDLITYRPISNAIASQFNVLHQSPQILVIRNGQSVFDTSHHMINLDRIRVAIS